MAFVVEALDGCVLDSAVHPLDLTVGPWVLCFGRPVLDIVFSTGKFKPDRADHRSALLYVQHSKLLPNDVLLKS